MIKEYNKLMRKCLKLATKGSGLVSPNPLVGAIVFDDNFRIISQGWHEKYGSNHAERNAILSSKEDVKNKNIIVNLEPCSHYGKTPPCADLIIEKGIKKVIIGMQDPNQKVNGEGIKKLKNAGIEVISGILEEECKELNKVFIKNQIEKKPYITIKTATTLDGKISTRTGNSKWITDEVSRNEVQKLRNFYDSILTSSKTVIDDNPYMTCRLKNGRNPVRIVLDTNLRTSPSSNIYKDDGTKVYIVFGENKDINERKKIFPSHIEFIEAPIKNNYINLNAAISLLYAKGIRSILIEAGSILNNSFISENIPDELIQFIAPKILSDEKGKGFSEGSERLEISECNKLNFKSTKILKNDIIIKGYFKR